MNGREKYYQVLNTSLEQFQSLILSSRSDQQLASLLQKRLDLQPSFIEGAVRRAVASRKIDLLKHSLEVNRLFPHDSTMRIDDETLLQQIQKAVVRQEFETLKCLLSYLTTPKHYSIEGILQNLAILATHLGFPDAVKLLCSKFPVCREQTCHGYSVLLALAGYDNEEFVNVMEDLLCSGMVHVNTQEPNGDTALHVAIREDNLAAVGLLIANGACTSIPNDKNVRPMDLALGTAHHPLLSGCSSPRPQNVSLYLAAMESDEEMILELIRVGVSVNSKWIHGRTALSAATINGDVRLFKLLLTLGADGFPSGSVWPELPVAHALKHGHFDIAYKLVERANDLYDMTTEAEKTHVYKQLVYLLHYCAQVGAAGVAVLVLSSRYMVDPSIAYIQGLSSLHVACQYGHLNMVKLLLDVGVDPDIRTDIYLNSPLHYASFYGHTHIARHLLDNYRGEVGLDCENKQHETPLFCVLHGQLSAQRKGPAQENSVVFLLARGAKLIKPGRKNCELSHFDLNYAAHRWDFIPFHTQKLIIVVRDEPRPFSLMNWCRFTIRGSITKLLNEDITDELGLSYRMQNFILLKDWFPTN